MQFIPTTITISSKELLKVITLISLMSLKINLLMPTINSKRKGTPPNRRTSPM
jgi:multisubunit Na+/H+ antiporter MnhC subunit